MSEPQPPTRFTIADAFSSVPLPQPEVELFAVFHASSVPRHGLLTGITLDPTVPPGEIDVRQDGVTVAKWPPRGET